MKKYDNLNQNYIAGQWREGRSDSETAVSNPWNGTTITTFRNANEEDLDEAYQAARQAQQWQTAQQERRQYPF